MQHLGRSELWDTGGQGEGRRNQGVLRSRKSHWRLGSQRKEVLTLVWGSRAQIGDPRNFVFPSFYSRPLCLLDLSAHPDFFLCERSAVIFVQVAR